MTKFHPGTPGSESRHRGGLKRAHPCEQSVSLQHPPEREILFARGMPQTRPVVAIPLKLRGPRKQPVPRQEKPKLSQPGEGHEIYPCLLREESGWSASIRSGVRTSRISGRRKASCTWWRRWIGQPICGELVAVIDDGHRFLRGGVAECLTAGPANRCVPSPHRRGFASDFWLLTSVSLCISGSTTRSGLHQSLDYRTPPATSPSPSAPPPETSETASSRGTVSKSRRRTPAWPPPPAPASHKGRSF